MRLVTTIVESRPKSGVMTRMAKKRIFHKEESVSLCPREGEYTHEFIPKFHTLYPPFLSQMERCAKCIGVEYFVRRANRLNGVIEQ